VAAGELTPPSERFDRAAERGYAAGYQEGRRVADAELAEVRAQIQGMRATAARELAGTRTALAAALTEAEASRAHSAQEAVDSVVGAAFALAEALLGRELGLSPHPVVDAIRRGLAEAPSGPTVVRVNPSDASNLADADDLDPFATIAPGREMSLVPDNAVEPGGCILEIGSATIDARLSTAIERVRQILLDDASVTDDGYDAGASAGPARDAA
jgi:flagellar assembly protein FliH